MQLLHAKEGWKGDVTSQAVFSSQNPISAFVGIRRSLISSVLTSVTRKLHDTSAFCNIVHVVLNSEFCAPLFGGLISYNLF